MKSTTLIWVLVAGLVAMSGRAGAVVIDKYAWQFPEISDVSGADDLIAELQGEVQAILDAGNLAPLYLSHADQQSVGYTLYNEPGRTIVTLAWAYPYLTETQQSAVRAYVANQLNSSDHAPWSAFPLPKTAGAPREAHQREKWWYSSSSFGLNRPSVQTIYGLWLYAWRSGDWSTVQAKWSNIKSMYSSRAAQGNLYGSMCAHVAMARLAERFNDSTARTTALANLQAQLDAGVSFATIEGNTQNRYNSPNMYDSRQNSTCYRGYMFLCLSPEIGRYLKDNVQTDTLARHDLGKSTFPYWWVLDASYFQRSHTGDEGTGLLPETRGMLFPVERWVVGSDAATLRKQVSSGPNGIGDCYWLEALVQAIEAHGTLTWTDVRGGPSTPPTAPSGLSATAVYATQVNLAWSDNSGDEETFSIERKTGAAGTWSEVGTVGPNQTTWSDMTASASTTYYYRVRAYNLAGYSSYSNEASVTTPMSIGPVAPSNLTASAISSSQIDLAWTDNASDETGYKIERKTAGGTYAEIAQVGANVTSYQNTGLTAGTEYFYRVRGYNGSGDSSYTNEASATTLAVAGPNLITNGDFEAASFTGWSWETTSTGASISTADKHGGTYSARFDANVGKPKMRQTFSTVPGTAYTATAWVRIISDNGVANWGGFQIEVTDSGWSSLGSVGSMRLSTHGGDWYRVTVNFTAISGTSRIQAAQFSSSTIIMVVHVDDITVTTAGAAPSQASAITPTGTTTQTIGEPTPSIDMGLQAKLTSSGQVDLNWTAAPPGSTTIIERKAGDGDWERIGRTLRTQYRDRNVVAGTLYSYRLRVISDGVQSLCDAVEVQIPRRSKSLLRLQRR